MILRRNNFKFYYHLNSYKIFFYLFLIAFIAQIFFWKQTEGVKFKTEIVPPAPNKYLISTLSLGDKEFLFRMLAMRLQNSGDIFAGFVALKNYDYQRVYNWMKSLDTLNEKSNFVPALASYYYSQTQNGKDTKYVVDYLLEHSEKDVDAKWWWLYQATFIAKDRMEDLNRALEVATVLSQNRAKEAPLWTRQLPAFLNAKLGNNCMAFLAIKKMMNENENNIRKTTPIEMDFMRHFINERLIELKKQNFNPKKCYNKK